MNKLAQYLNQHLVGEVLVDTPTLDIFATNSGPLKVKPEMVVVPQNTNDIRKLMRFAWQLAEKGHSLPVVARGLGENATGAALSSGVVIALDSHMDKIFEYDAKQCLVRLQPGVSAVSLRNAMNLQGVRVRGFDGPRQTIGGALSNGNTDQLVDAVEQLEVVLANGDILQTKKISKRELSKLKGQQTFEAEIYREVDGLLEDYAATIDGLDETDAAGYSALKAIKSKDGSIDLAPLFIGAQGTLGVLSEMILRTEYIAESNSVLVASFASAKDARDALDLLVEFDSVEYFDRELIARAEQSGKVYEFAQDAAAVIMVTFDDSSSRLQARKLKKLAKQLEKYNGLVLTAKALEGSEFESIRSVRAMSDRVTDSTISLASVDDAYVPLERFDEFRDGLTALSTKLEVVAPLYGRPAQGLWTARPSISLHSVSGKQRLVKFLDAYGKLVVRCGGYMAAGQSEGRLQASFIPLDKDVIELYDKLRKIFDPHNMLNPSAKQPVELRDMAKQLRGDGLYRSI